jgi:WD40 repeat protein
MKRELGLVAAALLITVAGLGQSLSSSAHERSFDLPKPAFMLHDENLHPQKPHTVLGPNGSFAVYAGTSMIRVSSLSFSADGKVLAVGSDPGIVDVWDVDARRKIRSFRGGTSVALSADGHWLAKDGNGIELVDMTSGKVQKTIPWSDDSDHMVEALSFDPTGRWLLVATNGLDLKVFDVTTGSLLATLANTRRGAFSSDGSLVVGGDYRHLVTWNTENWQVVRDLPNGPDYVTTVVVNSAKDVEIIGGPNSARLLKLTTGEEVAKIGGGYTNFAAFSKAGSKILTFTGAGFAVWNGDGQQECFTPAKGYHDMALSPDDRWLAAAPDNQLTDVALWNVNDVLAACSSATESRAGLSK